MPVSKQILGVKGDECQCGRRSTIRHCPSCGSTRHYARLHRWHEFANGRIERVENQFRCQACGHLYVDEERALCEAPPVGPALASQRVRALHEAVESGERLTPGEQKMADSLFKLMKTQGEPSSPEEATRLDNIIKTQLRQVYASMLLAHKQKPGEIAHPGEVEHYIESHFDEAKKLFLEATTR